MSSPAPALVAGLVVVVDDTDVVRALARLNLEELGWRVDECEGGRQALAYLEHTVPEAMLIDISMPRMSGDELVRQIRARLGSGIRLVGHTAHCMPDELRAFLAAGFDTLLVKPASQEEMSAARKARSSSGMQC
ncbi:MAG: response regulator, partial [Rubrivivax sp.]